jgi:23S rRNA C2498 (ribose-2'-O)-methylase RlmM
LEKGDYIVFADHKFAGEADRELQRLFPTAYKGERAGEHDQFFMARIEGDRNKILSAIKAGKLSFVDAAIPIDAVLDRTEKDYENVIEAMRRLLDKRRTFKIEVKRMNSGLCERAKSIEVKIGSALEAEGFRADLRSPEMIAYAILLNDKSIIGTIGKDQTENYVLDRFRSGQKETTCKVNRAEFKLEEAIEFFDVDLSKVGRALDIGASPGGWTHHLVTCGIKVVAVDNALLDYGRICQAGNVLVLAGREELSSVGTALKDRGVALADINDAGTELDSYSVIHIKTNSRHIEEGLLDRLGRFDLLTIDTNTAAADSAEIADSLAGTLNPDAHLIMTIKLFSSNIGKQIASAESGLSKSYDTLGIKKLPHNRDELTLHARKREIR